MVTDGQMRVVMVAAITVTTGLQKIAISGPLTTIDTINHQGTGVGGDQIDTLMMTGEW
jgi:hypothetical protein